MALDQFLWLVLAAWRPPAPERPAPAPPTAAAAISVDLQISPSRQWPPGGSPVRAAVLPPVQTCREGLDLVYSRHQAVPGHVDGARIGGANGLRLLRAAWGNALLIVRGGDFSGADLTGARLHNICFVETKLAGSRWRDARADGIGFVHVDLAGADLRAAKMRRVVFTSTALEDVNATGADLSDGVVGGGGGLGSLEKLRLDRADLRGFRFDCGIVSGEDCGSREGVSFRGARLARARVDIHFSEADWSGAIIDRTEIMPEQLLELGAARLAGPLRVRGGDRVVSLTPAEYARLRPQLSSPRGLLRRGELAAEAAAKRHPPDWIRPGATAVFVEPRIAFDRAARDGPLYHRLLPALIAGAWGHVMVRVNRDRTIDITGDAVGGNAHLCSVHGQRLRRDRATGWFVGPQKPYEIDPPEWRGKPMAVLLLWDDRAQVFQHGHAGYGGEGSDPRPSDYTMCGARAGFQQMVQVPTDHPESRRLLQAWRRVD